MTRRERVLLILSTAISRNAQDQKLLTGAQQHFRQNVMLRYMPVHYDRKTLYALLSRMEEDGLIQKSKLTDKSTLFVTPKGIEALVYSYSHRGLLEKPWDGKWRIVFYDVPEKDRYKREKMRAALSKFGFGMFQKSMYISPHDVIADARAYLAQEGLLSFATVLLAMQEDLPDARGLAERVFHTTERSEAYKSLLRRRQLVVGQQILERREIGLHKIRSEFMDIMGNDPFLPKELLPKDWPFSTARSALSETE